MTPSAISAEPTRSFLYERRYLIAASALGVLLFVALVMLVQLTITQLNRDLERTYHSLDTRAQVRLITAMLNELQAGQRAYLVVGDENYLDSSRRAEAHIDEEVLRLAQLTADAPNAHRNLPRLKALITLQHAQLQHEVELRRAQGLDAARTAIERQGDQHTMDQIHEILAGLESDEAQRLAAHREAQKLSVQRNFLMSAVFVALLAVLFLVIYYLIDREMALHATYEDTLAAANLELETKVQERTHTLEQSHVELRELTAAIERVQEEERKGIARELHDDLGQQLTLLKMDASRIKKQLASEQSSALELAERLDAVLTQTVRATRRIYSGLRPPMLDDLGLVAALEELAQRVSEGSGIRCRLEAPEDLSVPASLAMPLYRVAQESLNNVVKHAQANEATIVVFANDRGRIVLRVQDNGKGMDLQNPPKGKTFGLIGMRERIYAMGGDFSVSSKPGTGTTIEVSVPESRDS